MFRFTIAILLLLILFNADIANAKGRKGFPGRRGGGGTRYSAMDQQHGTPYSAAIPVFQGIIAASSI